MSKTNTFAISLTLTIMSSIIDDIIYGIKDRQSTKPLTDAATDSWQPYKRKYKGLQDELQNIIETQDKKSKCSVSSVSIARCFQGTKFHEYFLLKQQESMFLFKKMRWEHYNQNIQQVFKGH